MRAWHFIVLALAACIPALSQPIPQAGQRLLMNLASNRATGGGGFDPTTVATLREWYKPGTTVWKNSGGTPSADGDDVYSWRDSYSSAHLLGGAVLPKYRTTGGPNSHPSVDFKIPSFTQYLYASSVSQTDPIYIFTLIRISDQTSDSGIWCSTSPGSVGITISTNTTGVMNAGSSLTLPPIKDTNWIILSACLNGSSSWVRTNGVEYATGNAGSGSCSQAVLGNNAGFTAPMLGLITESLWYSGTTISTNNIGNIEMYLTNSYSLTNYFGP